ncbi:MAG: translation elongation factor Ts, partial [Ignavibacteria bacterium]|nr:translation elongation factor Ts [Ignavibacteria bacterium]
MITAEQVRNLREKTGAGMMDCKKALEESNGDFEKAVEYLRKKGAAVAAKRAERTANEGVVVTKLSPDSKTGVILELNCETDFVAKSDAFITLSNQLADAVMGGNFNNVDELLNGKINNLTAQDLMNELLAKVGEKVAVSRFKKVENPNGILIDYIHPGSKLGVLVAFESTKQIPENFLTLGKDITMQVAAMRPLVVKRDEVDK